MMIRPCKGRSVRKNEPPYRLLREEGESVEPSQYYVRRISKGDAEIVPAVKAKKEVKP